MNCIGNLSLAIVAASGSWLAVQEIGHRIKREAFLDQLLEHTAGGKGVQ